MLINDEIFEKSWICLQFQIMHSHLNISFICSEAIVIKKYGALISIPFMFLDVPTMDYNMK